MEKESKTYEINYLLTPLLPEDKVGDDVFALRKAIEDNNGLVIGEDQVKMQRLAYPIKKFDTAYFGWFRFTANPDSLEKIKNTAEKNANVLRLLAIEAGKENLPQFSPKRAFTAKKQEAAATEGAKEEIKPEQIDQKLDEILKESSV